MLFSLTMAVLLHKWEFQKFNLNFWKWVKKFDNQDFLILTVSASTVLYI